MKVKTNTITNHYWYDDEREIDREVTDVPDDYTEPIIERVGKYTIMGYLVREEYYDYLFEDDLEYQELVFMSHRHNSQSKMQEAHDLFEKSNKHPTKAPFVIPMDVYEHGLRHVSPMGEGMQCRWDTARGGCLWIAREGATEYLMSLPKDERVAKAHELARGAADYFNMLESGEVYGIIVDVWLGDEEGMTHESDSCWGFVGHDYAVEEMRSWVKNAVERLRKEDDGQ